MQKKQAPLRKRTLFSILLLAIYGLGKNIPLPYTDPFEAVEQLHRSSFLQLTSAATGGNFIVPTLFSLGLAPWMAGMIFWQLLTMAKIFGLDQLPPKQSDLWRNFLILCIAVIEGIGTLLMMKGQFTEFSQLHLYENTILLVAGSFFLIWLVNLNTLFGIGGSSLFILYGLVGSFNIQSALLLRDILKNTFLAPWLLLLLFIVVIGLITLGVIFERSEYRLKVERVMLDKRFIKTSYIPLKLNAGGSMAFMFGLTLLMLPQALFQMLVTYFPGNQTLIWLLNNSSSNAYFGVTLYNLILFSLTILFAYSMLDVTEMAENLRKSGDYFKGISPGKETVTYLKEKRRATAFIGASFTVIVAGLPLYLGVIWPRYAQVVMLPGLIVMLVGMLITVILQIRAIKILNNYDKLF